MDANQDVAITPPLLPKGGGAIQTIGQSWSAASGMGTASFDVPLPVSPCRTSAPALVLSYRNLLGNGLFGVGWSVGVPMIRCRTSHGVPAYDDTDTFVAPDDQWLVPDQDANGSPIVEAVARYGDHELDATYSVQRFRRRVDTACDLIERWTPPAGSGSPFWLIHGADGVLYVFGKSAHARLADPARPDHVAEWRLQESLTPLGEHVVYDYLSEDGFGAPGKQAGRDVSSARYLWRVRYGNTVGSAALYAWDGDAAYDAVNWQFELIFDYGQRGTDASIMPGYKEEHPWLFRADPFSDFAYGFEHRILRLCRQVLMYHRFPAWGNEPKLVRRTLFDYAESPFLTHLVGMQFMAYDEPDRVEYAPPLDFGWNGFNLLAGDYSPFPAMPGLDDGVQAQLVDLYGEGIAGVLYRDDDLWLYREPMRKPGTEDGVIYAPPVPLPTLSSVRGRDKVRDSWRGPSSMHGSFSLATRRMLMDHTGDGRLDWVIVDPDLNGFFTVNPDRTWSSFIPFAAVPTEFLHAQSQLADITGAGLVDLVLIGPRSVRLYPNRRKRGYGLASDVPHTDDTLPVFGGDNEVVAFADVLGSGQQHLVRIRGDGVECWPNLGRGRFGKGFRLADIDFGEKPFEPSRVFLADLDGSGAADVLYATGPELMIFQNRSGHGFEKAVARPWPLGLHYDRTWSISFADISGLGSASVVITTPHGSDGSLRPRHWRLDFVTAKPHLLAWTDNNCGCETGVTYRSSAQEWLDEKAESAPGHDAISRLPFPVHLVKRLIRIDQISGNAAHAISTYRGGYYDGGERQFRGFARCILLEREDPDGRYAEDSAVPAILTKTWYYVGDAKIDSSRQGFDPSDPDAIWPRPPLLTTWDSGKNADVIADDFDEHEKRELWRALAGAVRRVEVFGIDGSQYQERPYTISESRYLLRQIERPRCGRTHGVCMSMEAEQVVYTYERTPSDPKRTCSLVLRRDEFGYPLQSVAIACARRTTTPSFDDEEEAIVYWQSSQDDQQFMHYVTETRNAPWHLTDPQAWRLGLEGDSRENAAMVPAEQWPPEGMDYEQLTQPGNVLDATKRVLASYRYAVYDSNASGVPPFHGLAREVITAAMDKAAHDEYGEVLSSDDLQRYFERGGYEPMQGRLLDREELLWGTVSGLTVYESIETFYRPCQTTPCKTIGLTSLEYDASGLFVEKVIGPDGLTITTRYDYRLLQPRSIVDGNDNTYEVLTDALGRVRATSFWGTEHDVEHRRVERGFRPLSEWSLPSSTLPAWGIERSEDVMQDCATVHLYNAHAWMGQLVGNSGTSYADLRDHWMARHWITVDGYVRSHGRRASRCGEGRAGALSEVEQQPMHAASFVADRYPGEEGRHIQISVAYSDGFGRLLQTKRLAAPGEAWHMAEGADERPVKNHAAKRWAVAQRVIYHDRGFPIRAYRPYFSDTWCYTADASLGGIIFFDSYFYDALGRLTSTLNAKGGRRQTAFHAWYTVTEDENQTAAREAQTGAIVRSEQ